MNFLPGWLQSYLGKRQIARVFSNFDSLISKLRSGAQKLGKAMESLDKTNLAYQKKITANTSRIGLFNDKIKEASTLIENIEKLTGVDINGDGKIGDED
jgi:hypothetical protein